MCSPSERTAAVLDEGIPALSAAYNARFDSVFPIPPNYETSDSDSLRTFSKAITSNLIGGVGYFYGTSIVDRGFAYEWDQDDDSDPSDASGEKTGPTLVPPMSLLTATPSRSFFPRGFYWYVTAVRLFAGADTLALGMKASTFCTLATTTMISRQWCDAFNSTGTALTPSNADLKSSETGSTSSTRTAGSRASKF